MALTESLFNDTGTSSPPGSPIGYWTASGNANDLSATANNGRFSGSYSPGHSGQAFNLATGNVVIPDNPAYSLGPNFSIGFWFNTNGTGGGTFLGQDEGGGNLPKYFIDYGYANPGAFELHVNGPTGGAFLPTNPTPLPTGWNQLTIVRSSENYDFYLNGQQIGHQLFDGSFPDPTASLIFGSQEPGVAFFQGLLDDVLIYDHALTPAEIQTLAGRDNITSDPRLIGSGDPNAIVNFTVDGNPVASTVTIGPDGSWGYTPTGLRDGTHTIVASETDTAGNTDTTSLTFTLDTTPPVVSISDAVQTSSTVKKVTTITTVIKGHVDTNTSVVLSDTNQGGATSVLSSSITPDANGNWSFTTNSLPLGINTFTASATDISGNTGTSNRLLLGTSGKDTLSDASAGDVFIGNGGNDTVTGGGNNDVFAFHANFGKETITTFHYGSSSTHDVLDFDHNITALKGITMDGDLANFLLSHTQDTKNGAVITVDPNDTIVLQNVTNFRTQLTASDFHLI